MSKIDFLFYLKISIFSRSTAVGGRRKKSMFHVQRKQSVASLLFSALASPTSSDSGSRIRRRQSRAAGPPPRQWSVPERPSIERRPSAEGEDEEEPFCLIQKTNSMALSSPGGRSPPVRQLVGFWEFLEFWDEINFEK